jgi:hypothetical protein
VAKKKKNKDVNRDQLPEMYPNLSIKYYWEYSPNEREPYGYYYYLQVEDRDYHILGDGVSVNYENGDCVHTNMIPQSRFSKEINALSEESILRIINLPVEGMRKGKEEMDDLYERWKK